LALSYYDIQEALRDLLKAAVYNHVVKHFHIEAMARETTFDHMPFINIRLPNFDVEQRSIPDGDYVFLNLEIDVATMDFTEFKKAAKVRDDIVNTVISTVKANPRFHGDLSTAHVLGNVQLGAAEQEGAGQNVALATLTVVAEAYLDS
jgi:hypothetical protein